MKYGKANEIPAVNASCPADVFENAIKAFGVEQACEWFGYSADSKFTQKTVARLCYKSNVDVYGNMITVTEDSLGVKSYEGVKPETSFGSFEFSELKLPYRREDLLQTNLGVIGVSKGRLSGGRRLTTNSGYKDIAGNRWIVGDVDVREGNHRTIQDAIDWIKVSANIKYPV